jgi:hypothetical protein
MFEMPPIDAPLQSYYRQQQNRAKINERRRELGIKELKEDPFSGQGWRIEEEKKKNEW